MPRAPQHARWLAAAPAADAVAVLAPSARAKRGADQLHAHPGNGQASSSAGRWSARNPLDAISDRRPGIHVKGHLHLARDATRRGLTGLRAPARHHHHPQPTWRRYDKRRDGGTGETRS